MYAIIKTGGKQYKVQENDILTIERLDLEAGSKVTFDALMIGDQNGSVFGTPTVNGATVTAEVLEHGKGKKLHIFTYKAKKNIRKRQGHRQPYTKVQITTIEA